MMVRVIRFMDFGKEVTNRTCQHFSWYYLLIEDTMLTENSGFYFIFLPIDTPQWSAFLYVSPLLFLHFFYLHNCNIAQN